MDRKTDAARARELRRKATRAETVLWNQLRGRRLQDFKFRRQHRVGPYILDFYCSRARLAIELDGGGHAETDQATYDHERTRELESRGIRLMRFWNHDVLEQRRKVLAEIAKALASASALSPRPTPSGGKEGDIGEPRQ